MLAAGQGLLLLLLGGPGLIDWLQLLELESRRLSLTYPELRRLSSYQEKISESLLFGATTLSQRYPEVIPEASFLKFGQSESTTYKVCTKYLYFY